MEAHQSYPEVRNDQLQHVLTSLVDTLTHSEPFSIDNKAINHSVTLPFQTFTSSSGQVPFQPVFNGATTTTTTTTHNLASLSPPHPPPFRFPKLQLPFFEGINPLDWLFQGTSILTKFLGSPASTWLLSSCVGILKVV